MFTSNKFVKFLIFSLFCLASIQIIVKATFFHVSGTVYCKTAEPVPDYPPWSLKQPPPLAKVELWEEDNGRGAFFDPDDFLGETYTNKKGEFLLYDVNAGKEINGEEPYLLITHKCQRENGNETLNEGCSYISQIDLTELAQKESPIEIQKIEIFLALNEVKLNGTKTNLEIKTELKCE